MNLLIAPNLELGNSPDAHLFVERVPYHSELVWNYDNGYFWSEWSVFYTFIWKPKPEIPDDGFGGRRSDFVMCDGNIMSFYGGWASNSNMFWMETGRRSKEVILHENPYDPGIAGYCMKHDIIVKLLEDLGLRLLKAEWEDGNEFTECITIGDFNPLKDWRHKKDVWLPWMEAHPDNVWNYNKMSNTSRKVKA